MAIVDTDQPSLQERIALDRALADSSAEIVALIVGALRKDLDLGTQGEIDAVYGRYAQAGHPEIVRERLAELERIARRVS